MTSTVDGATTLSIIAHRRMTLGTLLFSMTFGRRVTKNILKSVISMSVILLNVVALNLLIS